MPCAIKAKSLTYGGFAAADPETSVADSASTAATPAALALMDVLDASDLQQFARLGHYFDALRLGRGAPPLALEHLAEGLDRDLELVERRLPRRQALQPEPGCQQRHQDPVVGVLSGEADQLVGDPRDHGQQQDPRRDQPVPDRPSEKGEHANRAPR